MSNYPESIDNLINPTETSRENTVSHLAQHGNANDAIVALQTKVGINNSADEASIDWILNNHSHGEDGQNLIPAGSIFPYAGSEAPSGYFLADGSEQSRATYSRLFGVIGTTYGAGNGSTTFNLPNLGGRTIFGLNSSDTSFDVLNESGGAKTVNLQHLHAVASHTHTMSSHTHTHSHTHVAPDHLHLTSWQDRDHIHQIATGGGAWDVYGNKIFGSGLSLINGQYAYDGRSVVLADREASYGGTVHSGGINQGHTHGYTQGADRVLTTGGASTATTSAPSTNTSGATAPNTGNELSTAQSVLPPYLTLNYIIKY